MNCVYAADNIMVIIKHLLHYQIGDIGCRPDADSGYDGYLV